MAKEQLSNELSARMEKETRERTFTDHSCRSDMAIRRHHNKPAPVWRPSFAKDIDRILYSPYYNRYTDKTQVLSLRKNDDITHRSLHVQLVSRIARTIGKALNLNQELIEAIALGHDIGHTPFGHTGERFLDKLYSEHTGRRFNHNVHSVRVLDKVFPLNLTLQTLNGIIAHNGELELSTYRPVPINNFAEFDKQVESCYIDAENVKRLTPSTLEGCVMRISDIIAYLGKDRHDAQTDDVLPVTQFYDRGIGKINAEIVNNLSVSIVENSYGKDYISMDRQFFDALSQSKRDNYALIYNNTQVTNIDCTLEKIIACVYEKLLKDLENGVKTSPIFTHHIDYLNRDYYAKRRLIPYLESTKNDIVVDYIASMTDDYLLELYRHLFPNGTLILKYKGYFE